MCNKAITSALIALCVIFSGCNSSTPLPHDIRLEAAPYEFNSSMVLHLQTEYGYGSDYKTIHADMEDMVETWLLQHPDYKDGRILEEGRTLSEHGGYMMRRLVTRK